MSGENATFTVANYGTAKAKIEYIEFGVVIVASTSDEGRNHRAFYSERKTVDSFSVGLLFSDYDSYALFGFWLAQYVDRIQDPNQRFSPMRVIVPTRGVDKLGIPSGGITAGDRVDAITYRLPLVFEGALDTTNLTTDISQFFAPNYQSNTEARYYYPTQFPLVGAQAGSDILADKSLYDTAPDPTTASLGTVTSDPLKGLGSAGNQILQGLKGFF